MSIFRTKPVIVGSIFLYIFWNIPSQARAAYFVDTAEALVVTDKAEALVVTEDAEAQQSSSSGLVSSGMQGTNVVLQGAVSGISGFVQKAVSAFQHETVSTVKPPLVEIAVEEMELVPVEEKTKKKSRMEVSVEEEIVKASEATEKITQGQQIVAENEIQNSDGGIKVLPGVFMGTSQEAISVSEVARQQATAESKSRSIEQQKTSTNAREPAEDEHDKRKAASLAAVAAGAAVGMAASFSAEGKTVAIPELPAGNQVVVQTLDQAKQEARSREEEGLLYPVLVAATEGSAAKATVSTDEAASESNHRLLGITALLLLLMGVSIALPISLANADGGDDETFTSGLDGMAGDGSGGNGNASDGSGNGTNNGDHGNQGGTDGQGNGMTENENGGSGSDNHDGTGGAGGGSSGGDGGGGVAPVPEPHTLLLLGLGVLGLLRKKGLLN